MNNAMFDSSSAEEDLPTHVYEQRLAQVAKVLELIRALNRDKRYIEFSNLVLLPSLHAAQTRLEGEKDHDEKTRLQGTIAALKSFVNLENLDHRYSAELQALKARLGPQPSN